MLKISFFHWLLLFIHFNAFRILMSCDVVKTNVHCVFNLLLQLLTILNLYFNRNLVMLKVFAALPPKRM